MSDIILASNSSARKSMLQNTGIDFDIMPANIDEKSFIQDQEPNDAAQILALHKALSVSKTYKEKYIIGSDQILTMDNKIYNKAETKNDALNRLKEFQGKTHYLISAVSIVKNSKEVFSFSDQAALTMKSLNNRQIEQYCDQAGDILTACVGCYAIEQSGIRLFESIKGDYFTILGMPLLPLLNFLEKEGVIS